MAKADDLSSFRQPSSWQLPNLSCTTASLEQRQNESSPVDTNHGGGMFSANMVLPGPAVLGLPDLKIGQTNEAHGLFQCWPPHIHSLLQNATCQKEKHFAFHQGLGGNVTPNALCGYTPKRLLIFDHSGNQTRLIFNSTHYPAQKPTVAAVCASKLNGEEQAAKMDKMYPTKPIMPEELGENRIVGEGSEMHENTEEINALLYSDDTDDDNDDDDDDDNGEDDEVVSTGHSPFVTKGSDDKQEEIEFMTEEVASSDGPTKRVRLLAGGYKKSSIIGTGSSVKASGSNHYNDEAESSCGKSRTQGEGEGSIVGKKRPRKDRIHETLRILENIVPGGKGKDPLVVLDEAINYLISLKLKAKAQGVFPY
ncbi:transcription factor bHLH143-like [Malania oleifera]|uniref:transcription factor bHLH143-like n=1 Tax=Malania oleifera TaxID=397392 RepID=UPI0025ADD7FA|nr:transcription factor bHLH143-like [Malania oleifera]